MSLCLFVFFLFLDFTKQITNVKATVSPLASQSPQHVRPHSQLQKLVQPKKEPQQHNAGVSATSFVSNSNSTDDSLETHFTEYKKGNYSLSACSNHS